jgi:hypothetical protein
MIANRLNNSFLCLKRNGFVAGNQSQLDPKNLQGKTEIDSVALSI